MAQLNESIAAFKLTDEGKKQPKTANYGFWGNVEFGSLTAQKIENLICTGFPYLTRIDPLETTTIDVVKKPTK